MDIQNKRLSDEAFYKQREEVLAQWHTGKDVDLEEAVAYHKAMPENRKFSKKLIEEEGIRGISASCGFNAIFQKEMADALDVPVFLSSILQVPYVQTIIGANKAVGVITAMGSALTRDHFRMCNVSDDVKIHVFGLENCTEWNSIFEALDNEVDLDVVRGEILATAKAALEEHPEIRVSEYIYDIYVQR